MNNFRKNNKNLKILTPFGYEHFLGVNKITKDCYIHLKFSNGKEIKCSEDHPFLTIEGTIKSKDLSKKCQIETEDGLGCFVVSKRKIKKRIHLYDIVNSGKKHLYYTNSIISHNCNFLGSTNTLITGEKLATLVYKEQIAKYSDMIIYEQPVKEAFDEDTGNLLNKDHLYVICVDVSEGKNLDYSAFSVFDVSCMPYKQVAVYRNNAIPPMLYPTVIKACAEYYNNAYVLIEINNNPQIASTMIEDLGYDNIIRAWSGNKRAQTAVLYSGRNITMGLKMSPLVKRIGCSTLKTLVENDKLIVNDFETISELTTFIQEGPSYKAEEGCNDDLAMTLVIFGWLATQKIFKEMVEHDVRKQLQLEHFDFREEDQLPAMQVDDGLQIEHFIESGSIWTEVNKPEPYGAILQDSYDY